ncbi:hypothetical protein Tco_0582561 [Tanacetum coccineum]
MPPISEVDIPEFDIEDVIDTDVLRTRPLVDVYESCNSVIEPKSYMDASKHFEWINAMKVELEEEIYQAPRAWFAKIDSHYLNHNLRRSSTENPVQHGRSKHINFKYHVIREAEKNEKVKLKYCTSETQLGDMLTKSITGKKLNYFKARLMESNNNLKEECDYKVFPMELEALLDLLCSSSLLEIDFCGYGSSYNIYWIRRMISHGYGVCYLLDTAYRSSWFLVKYGNKYVVSSLMDTAYSQSEQFL